MPPAAPAQPEPATAPKTEEKGPRFDFYAVLPQMEVIVPKGEDDAPAPGTQQWPYQHTERRGAQPPQ